MPEKLTETNRIEFKQELNDSLDLEKEIIAFLNYREGGILYIGIDKNGVPVGVKDLDGDMLKIKDRIRKNILPSPMGLFDVLMERIDGVPVIKIFVASGSEKPYYKTKYGLSEKGCFIRVGTAAEPMTTAMIEDLYAHRVRNSLRSIRSPRKNLTFRQLHIYYESKGLALNDHFLENLDLLTDNGDLNYVAYLLADENSMSIKVAKYSGTDRVDLIANNEYGFCSLLKATDQVLDKLKVENNVSSKITYKRRIDTPLWDERAMREIVINAIVHNDFYTNEVPPKFEIFSDRIEITSAGRLPIGMSENDFFSGISAPRNKELMRVFRDVDMVESLGSGMKRIQEVYSKDIFTFMNNFIRTTIYFKSQNYSAINANEKAFDAEVGSDGNVNGNVNISQLTDRQKNIISIIKEGSQITAKNYPENGNVNGSDGNVNGNVTTQYIVSKFNFSERTIFRELAELKRLGYITRVGSDKIGAWKVAETSIVENEKGSQKSTQENGSETAQEKITILSDMQRAILLYLNDHPKANRIELTSAIPNASTDGIKYNLARLQHIGLLKRIGSTRYGHWEVVLPIR
ncbi:MAG: putative DNA binding domain-containing protein [Bacteroidales bacterium]|nr:putative DNA binding domain-containing protein [Bacteroidales bacterium]